MKNDNKPEASQKPKRRPFHEEFAGQHWLPGVVPATVAGRLRHGKSDLFQRFQKLVQSLPIIENAPANTGERNIRVFPYPGLIQKID